MIDSAATDSILGLTAKIVAAHVANNAVEPAALPSLIVAVYQAMVNTSSTTEVSPAAPAPRPQPAVPIKRSIFPDYLVCLEDGKHFKTLKRHLKTTFGMTPDQYRTRWGLAADYPMVAPKYAERRSDLAKKIGLGTRSRSQTV